MAKAIVTTGGGAATEHHLASLAARAAMNNGGNAFDAVVAASFSLGVLQPHLSGLGGDFFALFFDASSGRVRCLNGSGWAPSGASLPALDGAGYKDIPLFGAHSVVVPGFVKGLCELHKRFGALGFAELLEPSIHYAEGGFPATPGFISSASKFWSDLPLSAKRGLGMTSESPKAGQLLRQPNLAHALWSIVEEGADAFYRGWIGDAIRETLSQGGVEVTANDFSSFASEWVNPLSIEYRGSTVYETPPNSMGATTLLILKQLEESEIQRLKPNSAERIELTLKAVVPSYERRDSMLADPRFVPPDLEGFLSLDAMPRPQATGERIPRADTTYFSVTDTEGNLISAIQSLFHHFGSRVYVEKAGIFLNNRGGAFKTDGPNKIEPRKRPLHTLSALLVGKEPKIAVGASGGGFRPQQHALFATNLIDYKMTLEEAIDFPRFLWDGRGGVIHEEGYHLPTTSPFQFRSIPHRSSAVGVAQGIEILERRGKRLVCDARGDGIPAGD